MLRAAGSESARFRLRSDVSTKHLRRVYAAVTPINVTRKSLETISACSPRSLFLVRTASKLTPIS